MEGPCNSENSLRSEIEEIKSGLELVTETMVLFQEFIEQEIGEMSYFRDSGSYYKLVEALNKMRVKTSKVANPQLTPSSFMKVQHRTSMEMDPRVSFDMEDDEQVEVDVDYNDDDPVDEITIRQVYSVPSPTKESAEALIKKNSSAVTITPVFAEERKREQQQFLLTQPNVMLVDKNALSTPQYLTAGSPFMLVEQPHARIIPFDGKDHQNLEQSPVATNNAQPPVSMKFFTNLPPPPPVFSEPITVKKSPKNDHTMKKSLLPINNSLKRKPRKVGKYASRMSAPNGNYTSRIAEDKPLNLKKKMKRPSECPVTCNFCGKSYSSKGVMSRHIKEAHRAEPQFACFYCPSKFRNGPARLEHMNSHHPSDLNSVVCPYCKRRSSSVAGKRNHMMLCSRKYRAILDSRSTNSAGGNGPQGSETRVNPTSSA